MSGARGRKRTHKAKKSRNFNRHYQSIEGIRGHRNAVRSFPCSSQPLGRFPRAQPMKLTQRNIAALTLPKGKPDHIEWDDDLPGFGYRIRGGGARTWIYQYKIPP